MASALAHVKAEWVLFKHDPPGVRFRKHRERMLHRSKKAKAAALVAGCILLAGGVVMLFIPGPGLLVIFFGLGLLASQSPRLARLLDRLEVRARRLGRHVKQRWVALSGPAKGSLLLGIGAIVGASMMVMWKYVVGAYVLRLIG